MKLSKWFLPTLLIIVGLCVGPFLIRRSTTPTLRLNACFHESTSLRRGADVRVAGVDAGKVISVIPDGPDCPVHIEFTLRLTEEFRSLPTNATADVHTDGVLGPSYVEIELPEVPGPAISDHGTVQVVDQKGVLDAKTAKKLKKFVNDTIDRMTVEPAEAGATTDGDRPHK